ncbi:hypothetical protein H0H81_010102 [Sphagnurus paluster]|uniref:Uncharacterized protein n=1 Tax=Sphagnurus paluster TaxID=117069 RepID=A0A9P7GNF7_9AGAR|nr:hypothetical protein H0H81_010102 [Sphagnurus paluster]
MSEEEEEYEVGEWEPVESFDSEDTILRFWERASLHGRDWRDLSLFEVGEEFVLTGPPRGKRKRKSLKANAVTPPVEPEVSTPAPKNGSAKGKRKLSPPVSEVEETGEEPPLKRPRENRKSSEPSSSKKPMPTQRDKRTPRKSSSSVVSPAKVTPTSKATTPPKAVPQSKPSSPTPKKSTHVPPNEIVPTSEDEMDLNSTGGDPMNIVDVAADVDMAQDSAVILDDSRLAIPAHRAKVANPKVKIANLHFLDDMVAAIPVKARLAVGQNAESSPGPSTASSRTKRASGSKPGPGRSSSGFVKKNTSSLLTFSKGQLKTVKGRYRKEVEEEPVPASPGEAESPEGSLWGNEQAPNNEIPGSSTFSGAQVPPTAEELLRLAGTNKDPEPLSDFEDPVTDQPIPEPTPSGPGTPTITQPPAAPMDSPSSEQTRSSLQQNLELAKDKLFPSAAASAPTTSNISAVWRRPTIFGPLGLGLDSQSTQEPTVTNTESSPFFLHLDASTSIPLILSEKPSVPGASSLDDIVGNKGPPGKFYIEKSALAVLDTVRAAGPSAKIMLDVCATDDHKSQFELFHSRLSAGELFVAMAGVEVLAFCSSDNALLSQRLNISPALLGRAGEILVARVVIENFSAYADAALAGAANSERWQWPGVV